MIDINASILSVKKKSKHSTVVTVFIYFSICIFLIGHLVFILGMTGLIGVRFFEGRMPVGFLWRCFIAGGIAIMLGIIGLYLGIWHDYRL
ncbi:hypothetical protein GMB70_05415 [Turicibacter sanguinis]|nr:hypothetical protein [Turicibacter sanguinis]